MLRQVSGVSRPATPLEISFCCNDSQRQPPQQQPYYGQVRRQHERQHDAPKLPHAARSASLETGYSCSLPLLLTKDQVVHIR